MRSKPRSKGFEMDILVSQGSIESAEADTLIVNLFDGVTSPGGATGAVDRAMGGAISNVIARGDFRGKAGQVLALYPGGDLPAHRVLVTGLGEPSDFDLEGVRQAAAAAIKKARQLGSKSVATIVHGAGIARLPVEEAAQATVEGMLLANYRYQADKQKLDDKPALMSLTVVEYSPQKLQDIESGVRSARAIAAGVALARDLVNLPPNVATPTRLAASAEEIANQHNMKLVVGDRAWAAERNMGGFLAVAKGAGEPPRFIVLEHNSEREDLDTLVLVGKGITFDTGGISIKGREGMGLMKSDMAGAAAVLGAMKTIGMLDLPLRIIGITPCTENMPDAHAYRPADVIKASNGKTIEVISTDAEGRMVLADGLVYAGRYNPDAVIDLATLTGACVIALGKGMAAGIFCNDDALRDQLLQAAETVHERLWPLPLWEDYMKALESDVADMKNSGGRFGGVATSAMFLKQFTDFPWAHLDIAGVAYTDNDSGYNTNGGTGFGVRLLTRFLKNWHKLNT